MHVTRNSPNILRGTSCSRSTGFRAHQALGVGRVNRLLTELLEQNKPVPGILAYWACIVVVRTWKEELKKPHKQGNSPFSSKDDRDVRIMHMYQLLRSREWTHEQALADIAEVFSTETKEMPEETIRSVFRKMQDFEPYEYSVIPEDFLQSVFASRNASRLPDPR